MKDLIAKLQMDANCAMGAIWLHIDAREARIAELEAENTKLRAGAKVVAEPVAQDADKLRELRARIYEMKEAAYTYGDNSKEAVCVALDGVLDEIDEVASTAVQAPVQQEPIKSITVTNGGSGYISPPEKFLRAPCAPIAASMAAAPEQEKK